MELQRIKLTLGYDGARFSGWAQQPGLRSVQEELQLAIDTALRREPGTTRLTVGGRTDAGVHARGQVAHFDLTEGELAQLDGKLATQAAAGEVATGELARARARRINGTLARRDGTDILVHRAETAPAEFDARFGALWRRYEYRIEPAPVDPLVRHFTAEIKRPFDPALLQAAAAELVGLRDFGAFCKAREGATSIRHLTHFEWREAERGAWAAKVQADAFCHSMVRALIGATVAVATGRISLARLVEIRDAAERTSGFTVMPAHGLSLEEIAYPADSELAARALQTRARRTES
ncbi:MAG: tRNA pseudouridine synthase A [Microbacteriaceae bacterium]|nr:tRNA pseudouridine synthase A [Microbacteriaceae bacterium]